MLTHDELNFAGPVESAAVISESLTRNLPGGHATEIGAPSHGGSREVEPSLGI